MDATPRPDMHQHIMQAVATAMLIYIVTLWVMPRDGFWINDNGVKFIQMQGLLLTGFRDASIPWPGAAIDPDYIFDPLLPPMGQLANGHLYGYYSFPFAGLSALPYKFLGLNGLYLIPLFGALLLLIAVGNIASLLPRRPVRSAVLLTALATPVWFYSVTFWEHVPAAALTTLSVFFCLRYYLHGKPLHLIYCAALLGIAIYFRDELYLFGLPLILVIAPARPFNWRVPLLFGVTAAAVLLPLWVFNWLEFGNILGIRLASASPTNIGAGTFLSDRIDVWRLLFLNGHENEWLSFLACAPFVLLLFWYPRVTARRFRGVMIGLGITGLICGLIVLSGHMGTDRPVWWLLRSNGLFAITPLLIWAFIRQKNKEPESSSSHQAKAAELLWRIVLAYAVLLALIAPIKSIPGIHWGCRLLLPLFPLMTLLAASNLVRVLEDGPRHKLVVGLSAALILISITLQVHGLTLLHGRKRFNAQLNQLVAERPEEVVVSVDGFIPAMLCRTFYDKEIFLATQSHPFNQLLAHLARHNIERVLVVTSKQINYPTVHVLHSMDDGLNFISIEIGTIDL